jgi:hypothetical protein
VRAAHFRDGRHATPYSQCTRGSDSRYSSSFDRPYEVSFFGERRHAPLPAEGHLPGFAGATGWLNSEPLTAEGLESTGTVDDV